MIANFAPKTNISRAYYKHLVNQIEHDPLIKHSSISVACLVAAICVLLGALIWFAKVNPGNLIQTTGTVTTISSGKTDTIGTVTTFVTFDFTTREGEQKSVRQPAAQGLEYHQNQEIRVGYSPKNPNYARNLHDNRPPQVSLYLWAMPFVILIWFLFVALFRYHARQEEIWRAAEAANSDD